MNAVIDATGVLSLPTPLAKLYGAALVTDLSVADLDPGFAAELDGDVGGIAAFGNTIRLHPGLDDDMRARVLAMGIAVCSCMVRLKEHREHDDDIVTRGGFIAITTTRDPSPRRPGRLADLIARACGYDGTAALQWFIIELDDIDEDEDDG